LQRSLEHLECQWWLTNSSLGFWNPETHTRIRDGCLQLAKCVFNQRRNAWARACGFCEVKTWLTLFLKMGMCAIIYYCSGNI
jgi:hypothetical protein